MFSKILTSDTDLDDHWLAVLLLVDQNDEDLLRLRFEMDLVFGSPTRLQLRPGNL